MTWVVHDQSFSAWPQQALNAITVYYRTHTDDQNALVLNVWRGPGGGGSPPARGRKDAAVGAEPQRSYPAATLRGSQRRRALRPQPAREPRTQRHVLPL